MFLLGKHWQEGSCEKQIRTKLGQNAPKCSKGFRLELPEALYC
jgi:hypothetical protein